MPLSRRGILSTFMVIPKLLRCAISILALVMPAAPQSCIPTTPGISMASRHASMSVFSKNGFPTCTADRISGSSSKDRDARPEAPCMPSRPVLEPTSNSRSPGASALALMTLALDISPTHIAFTNGFPEYRSSKSISPPTSGTPMQFPYPDIPDTTPLSKCRLRSVFSGPNRSEFSSAMGLAPIAKMSLTIPPMPVAAPSYGSTADG